ELLIMYLDKIKELPDDVNIYIYSDYSNPIRVFSYDLLCDVKQSKVVFRVDDSMEMVIFNKKQFNHVNRQEFKTQKEARYWLDYDVLEVLEGKLKFTKDLEISHLLNSKGV